MNSDFQSLDVLDYANVKCDDGICVEEKMLGCDFPAFIKNAFFCRGCVFHKSDLINQQQEQGTNKSIFRVTKKKKILSFVYSFPVSSTSLLYILLWG